MTNVGVRGIPWFEDDPERLERDKVDVGAFAPELTFIEPSNDAPNGGWVGELPLWPFERKVPSGLADHSPPNGLSVLVSYTEGYPMIAPDIWPIKPEPDVLERSQARWHVLPTGALCLLQTTGQWQPEASLTELLMKAAGWRLEYALVRGGRLQQMTESGIVSSDILDELFTEPIT
jgi:hypothetical protein